MSSNVIFHCTISDVKSHKASAVWASQEKILCQLWPWGIRICLYHFLQSNQSVMQQIQCILDNKVCNRPQYHYHLGVYQIRSWQRIYEWCWSICLKRHQQYVSFQPKQYNIMCSRALGPLAKGPQTNWHVWWGWHTTIQKDASTRPNDNIKILLNWINAWNLVFPSRWQQVDLEKAFFQPDYVNAKFNVRSINRRSHVLESNWDQCLEETDVLFW